MSCKKNLPERIEERVRGYTGWSRAERRRMDELVSEVIAHCSGGNGNRFIASWCDKNLADIFAR